MTGELISLGSINADFQMRVAALLGQQETIAARDLLRLSGGKAANVALLAHRLGCKARLLGRVGTDDLSEQALRPLQAAGLNVDGVLRSKTDGTAVAIIAVPPSGSKSILLAGEANLGFDDADIAQTVGWIEQAPDGSVLAVDYEISPAAASQAIVAARARGFKVVVDPSFPADVDVAALRGVTALTPNQSEAFELAGMSPEDPDDADALLHAAHRLAALAVDIVCIKLDHGGCLLLQDGEAWHQWAAPMKAVDTTGAGDAFTGAFAVALLEGQDARAAAEFAVTATELAVSIDGSQAGYRARGEFMERLHAAKRDVTPWGADSVRRRNASEAT